MTLGIRVYAVFKKPLKKEVFTVMVIEILRALEAPITISQLGQLTIRAELSFSLRSKSNSNSNGSPTLVRT